MADDGGRDRARNQELSNNVEMPDFTQLRQMLDELAIDEPGWSIDDIERLAFAFRDFRLELIRLRTDATREQLHRLLQMQYRLDMVVEGKAVAESISNEARRTLQAFGWPVLSSNS